jgi:uncharacterized protein (DUF427 family)
MAKTEASWNGTIVAASDHCISVEGNAYFPAAALKKSFFKPSTKTSHCGWKGTCNYFDVVVDGKTSANGAWVYEAPLPAAAPIKGYVAFWNGVVVTGAEHAKPMQKSDAAVC